jgi:hypothetical protein
VSGPCAPDSLPTGPGAADGWAGCWRLRAQADDQDHGSAGRVSASPWRLGLPGGACEVGGHDDQPIVRPGRARRSLSYGRGHLRSASAVRAFAGAVTDSNGPPSRPRTGRCGGGPRRRLISMRSLAHLGVGKEASALDCLRRHTRGHTAGVHGRSKRRLKKRRSRPCRLSMCA